MNRQEIEKIASDLEWGRRQMDFDLYLAIQEEANKGFCYPWNDPFFFLCDCADAWWPNIENAFMYFYRPKSQHKPNPVGESIGKERLTEFFRTNYPETVKWYEDKGWM